MPENANYSPLLLLRQLADHQDFAALKNAAQALLAETDEPHALPLLALAHAHLDFTFFSKPLATILCDQGYELWLPFPA